MKITKYFIRSAFVFLICLEYLVNAKYLNQANKRVVREVSASARPRNYFPMRKLSVFLSDCLVDCVMMKSDEELHQLKLQLEREKEKIQHKQKEDKLLMEKDRLKRLKLNAIFKENKQLAYLKDFYGPRYF